MILNHISCRKRLAGQTTKQPLSNFEPRNPWKYKQLWGLKPGTSYLQKQSVNKLKSFPLTSSENQRFSDDFREDFNLMLEAKSVNDLFKVWRSLI